MRGRGLALSALTLAGSTAACSFVYPTSGYAGAATTGGENDCASPQGTNLLATGNEDFSMGCAPWSPMFETTAQDVTTGRCSGREACLVCATDTPGAVSLVPGNPWLPGESYQFSAYMMKPGGDAGAELASVDTYFSQDGVTTPGTMGDIDGQWGRSEANYMVNVDGPPSSISLNIKVSPATGTSTGCVLVADAALVRVKDAGADSP